MCVLREEGGVESSSRSRTSGQRSSARNKECVFSFVSLAFELLADPLTSCSAPNPLRPSLSYPRRLRSTHTTFPPRLHPSPLTPPSAVSTFARSKPSWPTLPHLPYPRRPNPNQLPLDPLPRSRSAGASPLSPSRSSTRRWASCRSFRRAREPCRRGIC